MRVLLPAPLCLLVVPPSAGAATLAGERVQLDDGKTAFPGLRVTVTDPDGERNDVTILASGTSLRLRDDGAPLRVTGEGCRAVDDHEGICEAQRFDRFAVDLGRGDDRVRSSDVGDAVLLGPGADTGTGEALDGGEGDDVLRGGRLLGGPGDDVLTLAGSGGSTASGGEGDDRLLGTEAYDGLGGGPGRDEIRGAGGDDLLDGADGSEAAADLLDGGAGADTVSYDGRPTAVAISLAGGVASEDRLSAVENARGGSGDDVLSGDAGANVLDGAAGEDRVDGGADADQVAGGEGDDTVDGGAGDDRVTGGDGADRLLGGDGDDRVAGGNGVDTLDGGAGDDRLDAVDLVADRATCGPGRDRLDRTRGDATDRSCERRAARRTASLLEVQARRRGLPVIPVDGRQAMFVVLCGVSPDCRGTVGLRVAGRRVVTEHFDCRRDRGDPCDFGHASFGLLLPRRLAARIARRGPVRADLVVTFDPPGPAGTLVTRYRVVLARPG